MNDELKLLGEQYYEYTLETSPTSALMRGDHRFDDRMEDATREAEDEHIGRLRAFAFQAEMIDPGGLDTQQQVSREVLIFLTETAAADLESRRAELAVNPAIGFHRSLPVTAPEFPILEPEHAEALVAKYEAIGVYIDQETERLREGVARRHTPIARHVSETADQLGAYVDSSLADDPLLKVRVPEAFDDEQTTTWKDRLGEAIRDHIRPAFARQRDVLLQEVLPAAREDDKPGVCWLDDGDLTYTRAVHRLTSLPMDPREIHEIGHQQIDRLADEYRSLGSDVLGTSDLDEIYHKLRDDPEIHFDNGAEIVDISVAAMDRAKAEMGNWFGRLPTSDCVVHETPTGPIAFYFRPADDGSRPGVFFINTSDPSRWGRHEIESMAFHEGIPGHHLQIGIAIELQGIPEFQKHAWIPAYGEGWGLYSERLADEMGLFSTPLDRIGMLSADSMRACRLVVDTGMHALGWSRQKAIDYMADNSPMSIGAIEAEIDRYIGWPGQALSYMIGRLEIQGLRAEAEAAMGDRFDIKGFHDTVLGSGLMPLETLGTVVRKWAGI